MSAGDQDYRTGMLTGERNTDAWARAALFAADDAALYRALFLEAFEIIIAAQYLGCQESYETEFVLRCGKFAQEHESRARAIRDGQELGG